MNRKQVFAGFIFLFTTLVAGVGSSGAQTPFSPLFVSNLKLWLDGTRGLYTDAAKTTVCSVSGDLVYTWADQSGNGNDAVQATSANRPVFQLNQLGQPANLSGIEFTASSPSQLTTPAFLTSSTDTALTVIIVKKSVSPFGLVYLTAQTGGAYKLYFADNGTQTGMSAVNLSPSAGIAASTIGYPSGLGVDLWRYDGTKMLCAANGKPISLATTGNLGLNGCNFVIGNFVPSSYSFNGLIQEILVYNRALTNTEMRLLLQYESKKWGLSCPTATAVFCDGNSLTEGLGPIGTVNPNNISQYGAGQGYTDYLQAALTSVGIGWNVTNLGASGYTTQQLTFRATGAGGIDSFYNMARINVDVVWESTNDIIINNLSGATAYANLLTYAQARQATGFYVIPVTGTPRSAVGTGSLTAADFEARRQAANALLLSNVGLFSAVYDAGKDIVYGQIGNVSNTSIFVDGTHFSASSYLRFANQILPVVEKVGGVVTGGTKRKLQ